MSSHQNGGDFKSHQGVYFLFSMQFTNGHRLMGRVVPNKKQLKSKGQKNEPKINIFQYILIIFISVFYFLIKAMIHIV